MTDTNSPCDNRKKERSNNQITFVYTTESLTEVKNVNSFKECSDRDRK